MNVEVKPIQNQHLIYINGHAAGQIGDKDLLEIVAVWLRSAEPVIFNDWVRIKR